VSETLRMLAPAEALSLLLDRASIVPAECEPLAQAAGRVLAEPLRADRDSPARDVSAMDGYALAASEAREGPIPIGGDVFIGHEPPPCPPGAAVRIVTGGAIPAGTDAVVKREDVEELGDSIRMSAAALKALRPGAHVRRRAENLREGAEIVPAGTPISPGVAGALASCGNSHPSVRRRVHIGILSTGDEVVPVSTAPSPFQLRDSNSAALSSLFTSWAWTSVLPPRLGADSPEALAGAASDLLNSADLLLMTGGVSMGVRDFVPEVMRAMGATVLFHTVNQRPGKPLLGAVMPGGRLVLALPGNPVSALVCARRYAVPVAAAFAGAAALGGPLKARIESDDGRTLGMWWHRLVMRDPLGGLALAMHASSGDVPGAARADGFIEVPPGTNAGGVRDFYSWT